MTLNIIFNADDYGITPEVSRGIREAHLRGVVNSTSCMMNTQNAVDDLRAAIERTPDMRIGVHLTLTSGSPMVSSSMTPTVRGEDGNFIGYDKFISNRKTINIDEVKTEWRQQIEKFCLSAKFTPSHLDSHHHTSYFSPPLFRAFLDLAREYNTAIRLPVLNKETFQIVGFPVEIVSEMQNNLPVLFREYNLYAPDGFFSGFYGHNATKEVIINYIAQLSEGTYEIMCHPGYNDDILSRKSSYSAQREGELQTLTDPNLIDLLKDKRISVL